MSLKNRLSVIQNFICTSPGRKQLILENLPKMSEVFGDVDFYVSYNTEKNLKDLKTAYEKNIENVDFQYTDERDWAISTLGLLDKVKTPHVLYICEDFDYLETKEVWESTINEALDNDMDFVMMAKIDKYLQPEWRRHYHKSGKYLHYYHSKNTISKVLSVDAIYKKDFYVERLKEYSEKYSHHLPNNYETYYKNANNLSRFDLNCCIPNRPLVRERHPDDFTEARRSDLASVIPLGEKNDKAM